MASITKEVTFQRSSRRADKSISIQFITNLEQTSEQFMEIDKLINCTGIIHFTEKESLSKEEIKELDNFNIKIEKKGKSQSQRLRAVLAIYAKQQNKDVNEFYSFESEKIIQHYKDKLV